MKFVEKAKQVYTKAKAHAKVVYGNPKIGRLSLIADMSVPLFLLLILVGWNLVAALVLASGIAAALYANKKLKG